MADDRIDEDVTQARIHWRARVKSGPRACESCGNEATHSISHTDRDGTVTRVRWICEACLGSTTEGRGT